MVAPSLSTKSFLEILESFGTCSEVVFEECQDEKILICSGKEVFYNHFADKEIKDKWSDSYKLKKIDNSFLPKYLNDNYEKFHVFIHFFHNHTSIFTNHQVFL